MSDENLAPDILRRAGIAPPTSNRPVGGEANDTRRSRSFRSYPKPPVRPGPEAFLGLAGEFVRMVEPHSEADPAALLVQFLLAFGNVVGRGPHCLAEADEHHMNLFACLVGDTAKGRKGSSWGHVRRLFAEVDPSWAEGRIQSGLSSGEGLIWHVRDPISKSGADQEEVDSGVADKRLFIVEAEFASVLRVLDRQGNTLSAILREAWDNGDLSTLVKNNPAKATGAHVSLVAHVTADELRRYLNRTEAGNGFANRILFLWVRRSKALPEGGQPDADVLSELATTLCACVEAARKVGVVRRDEEARAVWHAVYPALSDGKPGLLGAIIGRAEAIVARLEVAYAILDGSKIVRPRHLLAALAVWDYAEASARYIFGEALGNPTADEILTALQGKPAGMSRTELRNLFQRNRSATEIDDALRQLHEGGLATDVAEDTGGRPTERWFAMEGTTKTTKGGIGGLWSFRSYLDLGKQALAHVRGEAE